MEEKIEREKREMEERMKIPRKVQRAYGAHVSGFSSSGDVEEKIGSEKKPTYLPFQGDGLKMTDTVQSKLTKAEILEARLKKMNEKIEN